MTQAKHFYHGVALTKIVEYPLFTALNKIDSKYGHYLVNDDIRLLVKYSSAEQSPWQFTFNVDDMRNIAADLQSGDWFFVCLVCGAETVCLLDEDELRRLIRPLKEPKKGEWIKVACHPGKSMQVMGSWLDLVHKVPHNRFPKALFE